MSCGGATFRIEAVLGTPGGTSFVVRQFLNQHSFFHHPVASIELGTALVENLAEQTTTIRETDINFKMVPLKYKDKIIVFPLNHM